MTNTFTATKWEESNYAEAENGVKLAYAKTSYAYGGQLEGESNSSGVLTYLPDGSGTYFGSELFTGTIEGRKGTVVLQVIGTFDAEAVVANLTVAPGTGTGELADIAGDGNYVFKMGTQSTEYSFSTRSAS